MTDIAVALRNAIIADATIAGLLSTYRSRPAVFMRHPAPSGAKYPYVLSGSDVTVRDEDFIRAPKPIVVRNISVYGEQKAHFREVEQIARRLRELFHRNPRALQVDGFHVIEITVIGPFDAPVSDDQNAGKAVSLTVRLQPIS